MATTAKDLLRKAESERKPSTFYRNFIANLRRRPAPLLSSAGRGKADTDSRTAFETTWESSFQTQAELMRGAIAAGWGARSRLFLYGYRVADEAFSCCWNALQRVVGGAC